MSDDEVALLLEKSSNSLSAAKLLIENSWADMAMSRIYYAMFYLAQAFLLIKGLSFSSHRAVISAFGREFVKTQEVPLQYHRFLIDAQIKRNEADYDIQPNITIEEARDMLGKAEEMLLFSVRYFNQRR